MAEITTPTTAAGARPSVRAALLAALVVSAVTLGIATFELSMSDWPSGFVLLVLVPLMALTFIGCGLWSMTLLLQIRRHGVKFAAPFLIYALTLLLLEYAPLQQIALQRNFAWHRTKKGTYVLFLTSRGLKHYFSGFLHVPAGAKPEDFFEFDDKPPSRLVRYDKDWYFVAN